MTFTNTGSLAVPLTHRPIEVRRRCVVDGEPLISLCSRQILGHTSCLTR